MPVGLNYLFEDTEKDVLKYVVVHINSLPGFIHFLVLSHILTNSCFCLTPSPTLFTRPSRASESPTKNIIVCCSGFKVASDPSCLFWAGVFAALSWLTLSAIRTRIK